MAPEENRSQGLYLGSEENMKLPAWTKALPKKVTICGIRYRITYNMRSGGAYFSGRNCVIKVGCTCGRDTAIQALIHEISEVAHMILLTRFNSGSWENGDMRFIMTHDDFERHNNELVAALKQCKLLRR